MPSRTEVTWTVVEPSSAMPPKMSGMKPELSFWNSGGNGPTDWPASRARLRPLKTSMPARVTMNDGILKNATQ